MSDEIPVSDTFEPVPGVDYGDNKVEQPQAEPAKAETIVPEQTVKPVEPTTEAEPKVEVQPEEKPKFKAKPIADLLSKKHELETALETQRAENQKLQEQIEKLSNQPASPQATDRISQLAEKHGIDLEVLTDIVSTAREGISPTLPKEVQDLIAERQSERQQRAEYEAFTKRVDSLAKTFKDEAFADPKVKEKLLALAYSTEKAPDGELYHEKELSELYFAYIKPEIEPGKASAEQSGGGSQATGKVMDFEEIYSKDDPKDIETMDSATFEKYNTWVRENKESKTPLKRNN